MNINIYKYQYLGRWDITDDDNLVAPGSTVRASAMFPSELENNNNWKMRNTNLANLVENHGAKGADHDDHRDHNHHQTNHWQCNHLKCNMLMRNIFCNNDRKMFDGYKLLI